MYLQIAADKAIDIALKVTPITMFGYTFAVLVIAIFAYTMYQRAIKAEEVNETQAKQMLEFGMKMSGQLAANQQLLTMIKTNPEDTKSILRIVEKINDDLHVLKLKLLHN
jgi:sensor histidine kinase regulating citrate/malate metabolism